MFTFFSSCSLFSFLTFFHESTRQVIFTKIKACNLSLERTTWKGDRKSGTGQRKWVELRKRLMGYVCAVEWVDAVSESQAIWVWSRRKGDEGDISANLWREDDCAVPVLGQDTRAAGVLWPHVRAGISHQEIDPFLFERPTQNRSYPHPSLHRNRYYPCINNSWESTRRHHSGSYQACLWIFMCVFL